MIDFKHASKLLNDRREFLKARIAHIEGDLRAPLDANFEDQATDIEVQEPMETMENAALAEIEQIDLALARIADGSYGKCAKCGGEISAKRLEAVPTATDCIDCAKE